MSCYHPAWLVNAVICMVDFKKLLPLVLCSALLMGSSGLVQAEIWGYVDDSGEVHLANKKLNDRYQLFTRSGEISDAVIAPGSANGLPKVAAPRANKALAENYRAIIQEVAQQHRIDPALLHAIITVESGYAPGAVSNKGAVGLMQVMPATGERFGITALGNPKANITAGAKYLKFLMALFKQDLPLVLAAYNAGEGAVQQYRNRIPPYPETQNYVAKVLAVYQGQRTFGGAVPVGGSNKKGRVSAIIAPDTPL